MIFLWFLVVFVLEMRTILFLFLLLFVSFCCMHLYFMFTAVSYQMLFHWCSFTRVSEINDLTWFDLESIPQELRPPSCSSIFWACATPHNQTAQHKDEALALCKCYPLPCSSGTPSEGCWNTMVYVPLKAIQLHMNQAVITVALEGIASCSPGEGM